MPSRETTWRLAIMHHAQEVTGNVALTCRYYAISRQCYYKWRAASFRASGSGNG